MTMENRIDSLSNEILAPHLEYLRSKQQGQFILVNNATIEQWSINLAAFLKLPKNTVREKLSRLNDAYQLNNLEYCLSIVNSFPALPGYPFMTNFNFSAHINYVNDYLNQTINNQPPKIPIIAFHKSASSYISGVLCRLFKVNPTVISFNHLKAMPAWTKGFAEWGGVIHDHYFPSTSNVALLRDAGIHQCVIHDRHPVEALISRAHHWAARQPTETNQQNPKKNTNIDLIRLYLDRHMDMLISYHGKWRRLWHQEAESHHIKIMNTSYDDMKLDKQLFFENLLYLLGASYDKDLLEKILIDIDTKKNTGVYNFRKASSDEWKETLTKPQIDKLKKLIDVEFPGLYF